MMKIRFALPTSFVGGRFEGTFEYADDTTDEQLESDWLKGTWDRILGIWQEANNND